MPETFSYTLVSEAPSTPPAIRPAPQFTPGTDGFAGIGTVDYGSDFSTYPDLDWGRSIYGAEAVVQAAMRAIEDAQIGTDIPLWLNNEMSPTDVHTLGERVKTAVVSDERVQACSVAAEDDGQDGISLTLTVALADGTTPFQKVLRVSQLGVEALQ